MQQLRDFLLFAGFLLSIDPVFGQGEAGVGIVLNMENKQLIVKRILPDSPAALSGAIRVGDRILAIAQAKGPAVSMDVLNLAQAIKLIRGAEGSTVRLTIVPAGESEERVRVVSLVRGQLKELVRWGDGQWLAPGTDAPDVELIRLPGEATEMLSDFRGRIVVLEFWATWCGPCLGAMAQLQTYSEKYPAWKDKVVLVAASVDAEREEAMKELKTRGWDRTHNVWVGLEAIKAYHVNAIPVVVVVDADGKVAATDHALDLPDVVNRLLHAPRPAPAQ